MKRQQKYIPALRFRFLTPIYDFVLRRLMQEERFKKILVQEANIFHALGVLQRFLEPLTFILVENRH